MRKSGYDISISLVVCFFLCVHANAQSVAFTWTYIDVDIEVREDGDLLISERQEYSFEMGPSEKRHELSRLFLMDRIDDIQDVEVYELTGDGGTSSEPLALRYAFDDRSKRLACLLVLRTGPAPDTHVPAEVSCHWRHPCGQIRERAPREIQKRIATKTHTAIHGRTILERRYMAQARSR